MSWDFGWTRYSIFLCILRVLPGQKAAQATAAEQVPKDDAGDLRLRSWFFLGGSTGVPEFIK